MTVSRASRIESVAERLRHFGVVAQLSEPLRVALEVQTLAGLFYFQAGDMNRETWFGSYKNTGIELIETTVHREETDTNVIAIAIYFELLQRCLLRSPRPTEESMDS